MGEDALLLLSHQVTLKGQNCVNYATVIKVHCTVGRGGGNSLMRRTGMFIVCLGWPVRTHPLPSKTSLPIFSLGRGCLYTGYLTDVKSARILVSLMVFRRKSQTFSWQADIA